MTSQRGTERKELNKIENLEMRIELILAILMQQLSDLLRNFTIHFRTCLYLVTFTQESRFRYSVGYKLE